MRERENNRKERERGRETYRGGKEREGEQEKGT